MYIDLHLCIYVGSRDATREHATDCGRVETFGSWQFSRSVACRSPIWKGFCRNSADVHLLWLQQDFRVHLNSLGPEVTAHPTSSHSDRSLTCFHPTNLRCRGVGCGKKCQWTSSTPRCERTPRFGCRGPWLPVKGRIAEEHVFRFLQTAMRWLSFGLLSRGCHAGRQSSEIEAGLLVHIVNNLCIIRGSHFWGAFIFYLGTRFFWFAASWSCAWQRFLLFASVRLLLFASLHFSFFLSFLRARCLLFLAFFLAASCLSFLLLGVFLAYALPLKP